MVSPSSIPPTVDLSKGKSAILDAIKDDLARLSGSLVGEEKQKLEAHLSFVRAAEVNLAKGMSNMIPVGSACEKLVAPKDLMKVSDVRLLPDIAKLQVGLHPPLRKVQKNV